MNEAANSFLRQRELPTLPSPLADESFLWCVMCERAFDRRDMRELDGHHLCPYEPCDGGTLFEPWSWSLIRRSNPGYPSQPEAGAVYPFFGVPEPLHRQSQ